MIGPYYLRKGTTIQRYDNWQKRWYAFDTTRDATYSTVDVLGHNDGVVRLSIPSKRYPHIDVNERDLYLDTVTTKGAKKKSKAKAIAEAQSEFNEIWNDTFDIEGSVKRQVVKRMTEILDTEFMKGAQK